MYDLPVCDFDVPDSHHGPSVGEVSVALVGVKTMVHLEDAAVALEAVILLPLVSHGAPCGHFIKALEHGNVFGSSHPDTILLLTVGIDEYSLAQLGASGYGCECVCARLHLLCPLCLIDESAVGVRLGCIQIPHAFITVIVLPRISVSLVREIVSPQQFPSLLFEKLVVVVNLGLVRPRFHPRILQVFGRLGKHCALCHDECYAANPYKRPGDALIEVHRRHLVCHVHQVVQRTVGRDEECDEHARIQYVEVDRCGIIKVYQSRVDKYQVWCADGGYRQEKQDDERNKEEDAAKHDKQHARFSYDAEESRQASLRASCRCRLAVAACVLSIDRHFVGKRLWVHLLSSHLQAVLRGRGLRHDDGQENVCDDKRRCDVYPKEEMVEVYVDT